ncbi:hypothetical protein BO71DRAFT_353291 [Aspergillus ellipticus CBS 707.79]|uniref:Rhodopsin domain-containing protein n=1 Tax=Aspergillus ellipticus CBS 707.79 TaxID=1448320 RepID=A0A319DBH6_9EURO|nr:hypothetical protein BO71DRAFT_353291 [Aspergillus ellipticus CBS 707.79]
MGSSLPLVGHSLGIFICAAVMMGISIVAVVSRTFVRLYVVRAFGWDDALMVIALALFIALSACWMIGAERGIGHKNEDFSNLKSMQEALLLWWLCQLLYLWSSALAKLSIALALLRVAVNKMHRLILWAIIGLVISIGLMIWLTFLLDCQPISHFWMRVDPTNPGKCGSPDVLLAIAYVYSSLTVVCDVTLGVMPAVVLWGLQMSHRTKIALAIVLSLGAIASVAVIIRIPYLHTYTDPEFLYATYQITIWSIIETGIGLTAGSLATLRALFRWFLDGSRYASSYQGRTSHSGKRSRGPHPLVSLTVDVPKKTLQNPSYDPSYWRPDMLSGRMDNRTVTTVSSPMTAYPPSFGNSSQENLTPKPDPWKDRPWKERHHVSIHTTFDVSEGDGGMI